MILPDETRACPTREVLPLVLGELEAYHPSELKIFIGSGLRRGVSKLEMIELLGYYNLRGWNHDGKPTKERLAELGLLETLKPFWE